MSDNINIQSQSTDPPAEPLTREEQYLSAIAGVTPSSDIPEKPLTRIERYLNKIVENGAGGSGFEPTDEQLAAMNSGITSEDVEQIDTNKNNILSKANISDVNTATANLQAQIDELITPVTQDAEVQNARVGEDSTPYTTLKNRLDFENSTIKENIRAIEECIGSIIDSYSIYSNAGTEIIDRQFVEANIYKGKTYKLVIDVPKNYTHSNNAAVLNVRTTVTDDNSEIIDQITGEIRGTLTKGRYSYEFTATNDAQYLYIYINAAEQPVNLTVSLYNPGSIRDEIEYLSGTRSPYKYSGERVSMKQYSYDMNLKYKTLKPSLIDNAWQGCAAYGDYLFRFFHTGVCAVYNAESGGSAISTFELGSHSADNHANNANFGSNKYNINDEFPLLYVTDGNSGEVMRCAVERIVRSNDTFTATKVQTIDLDQTDFESRGLIPYWGWSAWLIADNALYYFGCKYRTNGSQTAHDAENVYIITKFGIPDLSNPTVTLTAADVVEQWTTAYDTELTQGGCIYNDYIFYAFGTGGLQYPCAIKVFSLSQKSSIAKILLTDTPLRNIELEDLTVRNNKLIIAAQSEDIYEIDFA